MSVKNTTDAIVFIADDHNLQTGQSVSTLCPFCRGGATKERSFSVGVIPAGVWYRCWRAKCGEKGLISANGTRTIAHTISGSSQADVDRHKHDEMVEYQIERLPSPDEQKFRIQAYDGRVKGVHLRHKHGARITNLKTGEIAGGFFFPESPNDHKGPVVVVEDPISADAVSVYTLSYCLFGTNLSEDKIAEIVAACYPRRSIWLCLDKDATVKAAEYVLKYRFIAPNLKLMPIQKDLKHWSDEELRKFIYG